MKAARGGGCFSENSMGAAFQSGGGVAAPVSSDWVGTFFGMYSKIRGWPGCRCRGVPAVGGFPVVFQDLDLCRAQKRFATTEQCH